MAAARLPTAAEKTVPRPPPTRLPTPGSSTGVPSPTASPSRPGDRQKGSARDLLRKHYGLGVTPPQPLPGRTHDPMDIDSPAFDAKAYYDQLITTTNLTTLLRRENELLTEMRELDSERQSLVYNHHHELIAATDTIAAMRDRAESLDADLDKLRDAFSEISRLTAELVVEQPSPDTPNHSTTRTDG